VDLRVIPSDSRGADLRGLPMHRVVALPEWRERLAVRIAAHDLALAAHSMLDDQDEQTSVPAWRSSRSSTPRPPPAPAWARPRRSAATAARRSDVLDVLVAEAPQRGLLASQPGRDRDRDRDIDVRGGEFSRSHVRRISRSGALELVAQDTKALREEGVPASDVLDKLAAMRTHTDRQAHVA